MTRITGHREATAMGPEPIRPGLQGQFLSRLTELLGPGSEDAAIDYVIETLDELLRIGSFTSCDQILEGSINAIPSFSAGLIASFLGITCKAKDSLPSRAAFFDEAERFSTQKWGVEESNRLLHWFK
jgi:hypothetical protein